MVTVKIRETGIKAAIILILILLGITGLSGKNVSAYSMERPLDQEQNQKINSILSELQNQDKTATEESSGESIGLLSSPLTPSTNKNIIVNGDFESDLEDKGSWIIYSDETRNRPVFTWDDHTYNGQSGNSVSIQGNDVRGALMNKITIKPGNTYSFSAFGKASNVTEDGVSIYIAQYDKDGDLIGGTENYFMEGGTFDWDQAKVNFVSNPKASRAYIILMLDGSGTVWFDDISLTNLGAIPTSPLELSANPGTNISTFKGFKVTLDGSKSLTSEGTSLGYNWSILSQPEGSSCVLSDTNTANPYFTPDVAGDYVVSLTVDDGLGNTDTKQVTVRAKLFNDITDDADYNMLFNLTKNITSGYTFQDFIPLVDGWIIIGETNKNQVIILNAITGDIAKTYQLQATPNRIDFDFEHGIIIATQSVTNNIAKIDVNADEVTYIAASTNTIIGGNSDVVFGPDGIAFFLRNKWAGSWIGIIDTTQNLEVGHIKINSEDLRFMVFNKNSDDLILGEGGMSPSSLSICTYNAQNHSLNLDQTVIDLGGNGENLAISNDGQHLAFCCGGGNGDGYTIFDIDSSNLKNNFGEWVTGAYPVDAVFSYDNKYLIATNETDVLLFDVYTHTLIKKVGPSSRLNVTKIGISRGGEAGYACIEGDLYVFRINDSSVLPLTMDSISTDKESPQRKNTSINITANISGGMGNNYYHFLVYDGNEWLFEQSYSESNTFTWQPQEDGKYYLVVEARDINSSNVYDVYNTIVYDINSQTVPDAPAIATVTPGNSQATVTFTAPASDGGSPITGYTIISNPAGGTDINAGTTALSHVVTGLTNGTSYTFTVTATNAIGTSAASTVSNAATPYHNSSSSGGGGGGGASSTTTSTANSGKAQAIIHGQKQTIGKIETQTVNNQTVTTVTMDPGEFQEVFAKNNESDNVVSIPINTKSDVAIGVMDGQNAKLMETNNAVLEIKTENATYTLPAAEINIDNISSQIGETVALKDIKVSITIAEPPASTVQIVEDTANKNNYQIVVEPIEFTVTCSNEDKTINVSKFNGYVERVVAIPAGVDPSKITTGVVLNKDGTFSHVPTTIFEVDGQYYAKIKSLTNSTYSVIFNPQSFKDVASHWAREAINDMGSRLIVGGTGNDMFDPDRAITRAEFAALMVRGLGLSTDTETSSFTDVNNNEWYSNYIGTAHQYGIISGYGDGKFSPNDKITREQAMSIIARAMNITGLKMELQDGEAEELLTGFIDENESSAWAKTGIAACIKAGIVSGQDGQRLASQDDITRAEVATIIRNLLKKSGLI